METLESILVGIDGSERGKKALKWAARLANREGAHLTLLAVIDPASNELVGSDHRVLREAVENVLGEAQDFVRGDYPELAMDASYVSGDIVEALVGAAESHDMIVMGSHHGASVAERVWGAKGLRVSVSASVPTVVVPADWDPYNEAKGIVVGVGPQDEVSDKAVELGVHLAKVLEEPLELISSWASPPCFRALLNSWVVAWRRLANLSSATSTHVLRLFVQQSLPLRLKVIQLRLLPLRRL